jgi:hypothetical protein
LFTGSIQNFCVKVPRGKRGAEVQLSAASLKNHFRANIVRAGLNYRF